MCYADFIYFILSNEDKTTVQSLSYWFRCVDIDGDNVIRAHEIDEFYKEQLHRLESLGQQTILLEDIVCQMCDILRKQDDEFYLKDFTNINIIEQSGICFEMLFDVNKFLDFEDRNPFLSKQLSDEDISPWRRFSRNKYQELLEPDNGWDDI